MALGCSGGLSPAADSALDSGRIAGSILGASHRIGHRLRQPRGPATRWPAPQQTRDVPVVIVGGGIAGLSAAWKLARSGFREFTVLELEPEPGGNSRSGGNEVSAYPWGAHYLPVPTAEATAVRELVEEMGLVEGYGPDGAPRYDPRHLCHAPQERRFVDGRWRAGLSARDVVDPDGDGSGAMVELAAFERQVAEFRDYRDAGGRRAFALPVALSTADPAIVGLDRLSMAEYFDRAGWTSPDLRWYVDYCCRDDYGCTIDTTSAWAGWHYFCSRPDDVEYLTWPEGNGRIVRHYLDRIGDRVHTGRLVFRVRATDAPGVAALPGGGEAPGVAGAPRGAGPPGIGGTGRTPGSGGAGRSQAGMTPGGGVEIDVLDTRTETAERFRARRCIYALPRFTAPHVIEGYGPAGLDAFTYCPWMVANLTVRRLPDGAAWDNVLADSPSLGYVVATHQDLRIAPGRSVLTYYLPLTAPNPAAARAWMLEREWRDWVSLILADLGQAHPDIESLVTHVDVMLWGHAMIRPVPGFIWGEERRGAASRHGAVRFAHSDMSGISVFEEAQYHGVRAAEEVMRELGHPFASSL
ncbi:MAG: FAD-dependent oxidoreductase [Acidobacteria bacterium]|nr:FAD-dependent oxidoreductase [Acidobacteriota bacterium]